MKKILVLLLAILMVFAVVACKQEPEEKKGELPVDKEVGKEKLLDQGDVAKAVDHTGFKIAVSIDDGEAPLSFNIGGKDGVYWVSGLGVTAFVREHDSKTYGYSSELDKWVKIADVTLKEKVFDEMVDAILYNAYEDEIKDVLLDAGSEKKSGRDCKKYSVSFTDPDTKVAYKFNLWVDKEYGITMGMEALAGGAAFTYTIDPKLSGLVAGDLPDGYADALACETFDDSLL